MDPSLFILKNMPPKFEVYRYNDDFSKEEPIVDIIMNHSQTKLNYSALLPTQSSAQSSALLPANLEFVYNLSLTITSTIENHIPRTILDTINDDLFKFLKTRNLNLELMTSDSGLTNIIHTTRDNIDKALELLLPDPSSVLLVRFDKEPDSHILGFPLSFIFNQVSYLFPITSNHLYLVCQGYFPENKKSVLSYIKKKSRKGTSNYNLFLEKIGNETKNLTPTVADQNRLFTEWGINNSVPETPYLDILSLLKNYKNDFQDSLSELENLLLKNTPIKKYFIHENNKNFYMILFPFLKKYNIQL